MQGANLSGSAAGLICSISGHSASNQRIRNAGHHFARCTRCNADLVENDGRWSTAPRGFRVIWKAVAPETQSVLDLDVELEPESQPEAPVEETEASQVPEDRRGLDRRVNRYAVVYKGIERRRNRDRRQSFGRKSAAS
jgi:hypothetical protein